MRSVPVFPMLKLAAVLCLGSSCCLACAAQNTVVTRAYADGRSHVHILTSRGRDLELPLEKGQEGVESVRVAPDGRTVGWLVETSSCCVSYPIPLELVVWRSGHTLRRIHPTMAIWSWVFLLNGAEIGYRMSPLHGGWSGECVLLELLTGKNLATWDHPTDENGNDTEEDFGEPDWAKQLP